MSVEDLLNLPSIYDKFQLLDRSIEHTKKFADKKQLRAISNIILVKIFSLEKSRKLKIKQALLSFVASLSVFVVFLMISTTINVHTAHFPWLFNYVVTVGVWCFWVKYDFLPFVIKFKNRWEEKTVLKMFETYLEKNRE